MTVRELLDARWGAAAGGGRVPSGVLAALRRGTAEDPTRRFASIDALVEAVETALHARGRRVAAVLGVGLVAAAIPFGFRALAERRREAECAAEAARIDEVWNPGVRADVRRGLLATGLPYAAGTADWVDAALERWVSDWREVRAAGCLDGPDLGDDRRTSCIEDRVQDLAETIAGFEHARAEAVPDAVATTHELMPARLCATPRSSAQIAGPETPEERVEMSSVRVELSRMAVAGRAGKNDWVVELGEAALAAATELDWPPLIVAARWRLGVGLTTTGDFHRAQSVLLAAYFEAERIGWTEAALDAAVRLTVVSGLQLRHLDEADRRARRSASALDWLPHRDLWREMTYESVMGMLASARADGPEMVRWFERATTTAERALGPDHPDAVTAMTNLAAALIRDPGRDSPGAGAPRAGARVSESTCSTSTTRRWRTPCRTSAMRTRCSARPTRRWRRTSARSRCGSDRWDRTPLRSRPPWGRSRPSCGTSASTAARGRRLSARFATRQRSLDPGGLAVAELTEIQASIHSAEHDEQRALELYEGVLAVVERAAGPEDPRTGLALANVGLAELDVGRPARAAEHLRRGIEVMSATLPPEHEYLASSFAGLAGAELALGHAGQALEPAERAVASRRAAASAPDGIAEAELVLARALWESGGDRRRARSLALDARDTWRGLGPARAEAAAGADAWLAAH